ncbi:MAG TPA: N-acetylmuramoyl-L-alanine amidase [Actinophytocola sp.]|uniref:N-acetylmuramoyl-L-alanine amidase n=1 Tax=Actinophytocola sp. TaxID=1872138 RepID=UPI002DBF8497|nr:N-acetylmuramoyl-L-alanine amidase [Actinophytocola sp.]HEU5470866.1 N-acetylmuramoyl-L-alanine amidase [Actinophytocola sp.]
MLTRRGAYAWGILTISVALAACGAQDRIAGQAFGPALPAPPVASTAPATVSTTPASPPPATSSSAPPATTPKPAAPAGRVVVLDPGHNGGNAANPAAINKSVPAGRGKTKACNTTGTATDAGYAEHAFTWDTANRVREILAGRGVRVVLTRPNDSGVGPCVDQRAAIGNRENAAAVVSIHADGSTAEGAHGFHVAYSAPALNAAQGEPSQRLARTVRDRMVAAGLATSTYIGSNGLSPRDDLAGLNLSERPAVLVECGNMRDADEAARLSSPDGRQRYAAAIAEGILAYLG